MIAKPIVDGLERDLSGTAAVIRLDVGSQLGQQIAGRYGLSGVPTLLVLDGEGQLVYRQGGPPTKSNVLEAVSEVTGR